LTREELVEKFMDCIQRTLTPDQAEKLIKAIESLEDLDSIRPLIEMASIP
jgi:hypothetical protein